MLWHFLALFALDTTLFIQPSSYGFFTAWNCFAFDNHVFFVLRWLYSCHKLVSIIFDSITARSVSWIASSIELTEQISISLNYLDILLRTLPLIVTLGISGNKAHYPLFNVLSKQHWWSSPRWRSRLRGRLLCFLEGVMGSYIFSYTWMSHVSQYLMNRHVNRKMWLHMPCTTSEHGPWTLQA